MQLEEIQRRGRELFRLEAADLLGELEAALLALEGAPADADLLGRVFRVMHTLKGSGATAGFPALSDFLHRVEDVYNAAREGRVTVNREIVDRTLRLRDVVAAYLAAPDAAADAVLTAARPDLDALLANLPQRSGPLPVHAAVSAPVATPPAATTYAIRFAPRADLFRQGFDPAMFLDGLRALGPCDVRADLARLPEFSALDPEACHASWAATLETAESVEAIRGVFMFIEDACTLEIRPVTSIAAGDRRVEFTVTARALDAPGAVDAVLRDLARLGPIVPLQEARDAAGRPAAGAWSLLLSSPAGDPEILDTFIFLPDAAPRIVRANQAAPAVAPEAPAAPRPAAAEPVKRAVSSQDETLRVSAQRLDQLVNLVGRLVILRSQVRDACAQLNTPSPALRSADEALQTLSEEMRDVVLHLRMMPIEETFAKFRRLVRDLSRELGKEAELVIEGGETEMDKTMLEALADPLMHLVRNSLDHGLEAPDVRVAAGKPARGVLRLRAEQRGDRVLVSVADDGRGLDAEKIRAKAVRNCLIAADARPTESELHQLIFLPGFSTADAISLVSGRGVGLDVVRKQVERLRGRVEVVSVPGRGAEFHLSLPLTLAIIEGLMVEVDGDRYVLPLSVARETIELAAAQRRSANGRNLVTLRGEPVPYLRLRDLFACTTGAPDPERVVVVEHEGQRLGVVVDRVIGNHQTVIKSLGWLGGRVPVFSGATVLGDGRIALILDLPALLSLRNRQTGTGKGMEP